MTSAMASSPLTPGDFAVYSWLRLTGPITPGALAKDLGMHQPMSPRFAGNIYILIDGGCFSTTSEFLSQMHANTKAVFIGEESGGNYYSDNSGISADIILPNSKLQVNIPMLKYTIAVPEGYAYKAHGIIPQYIVLPTVKDREAKKDPVMEKAMELIKK